MREVSPSRRRSAYSTVLGSNSNSLTESAATVASISASARSADTALSRRSARSSPATNTPASRRNTTSARRSRVWKSPAILYHAALSDNNNVR